ncbi:MAG: DUF4249 family protein [Bacteroidales bacterium]|nr:DUF4249 family protein [Bacteroidales bacterium]
MKKLIYFAVLFFLMCSCTKEIELDYNDIEPIPVIEGHLTPDTAEVIITKTRNMNDSVKTEGIKVDDVRIILPDGEEFQMDFQSDGYYRLDSKKINLVTGNTYKLKVTIDGVEYTGESTLQPKIEISEPEFLWTYFMDWMQVLEFETTNVPDNLQVYCWARIYRNGKIYFSDAGSCKGNFPFDIGLYYDSDMENDPEMILNDGDNLKLEFRSIDEDVYNYLAEYNQTKTNPKQYFTTSVEGKICLGFFAVYDYVVFETTYVKTPHEQR